ncbi:MAG: hypothetical protein Fur006_05290 [Coleofasciculaceae cyanobacterium]
MSGIGWTVTIGLTLGVVSLSVSLAPKDPPPEQPPPQVENPRNQQTPPKVSYHQAPESWCLGMRDQWKFRQQHFNTDDESIRKSME